MVFKERTIMLTLRDLLQMLDAPIVETPAGNPGPWVIGTKYLIRTVTNYWVGELCAVYPIELVLKSASWIADTGRYSDCLQVGNFKEVEPVHRGHVIIGRGSIDDAVEWHHQLPTEQK